MDRLMRLGGNNYNQFDFVYPPGVNNITIMDDWNIDKDLKN